MKLFEPLTAGPLSLENRIVMPAMGTLLANRDGTVSGRLIRHYARRAAGPALVIVEATGIHVEGAGLYNELKIFDDRFVEGLASLAAAVKSRGALAGIQLYHPGRQAASAEITGRQPVAPSAIPYHPKAGIPHALSIDEIAQLVEEFAEGARRAKEAGFDLVEFHGAHGYLIAQFLSPLANSREDRYGGETANRARFAVEIVRRTRERLGAGFPISIRISGDEYQPGGLTIAESARIARILEAAGVNLVDVSAGTKATIEWMIQPMMKPRGCLAALAETIRRSVTVPVMAAGRINDPTVAECILAKGQADLVGIGRGLLADPDLPGKAMRGDFERIRKCIACNACADHLFRNEPIRCGLNPDVGRDTPVEPAAAAPAKKIVVVGGGPAGLEAARILALRGHDVTLYEKEDALGGQLAWAGIPEEKRELLDLAEHLERELRKLKVTVVLGTEFDADCVTDRSCDEVVLATGTDHAIPAIPGIGSRRVLTAKAALKGDGAIGQRVAVIGAGGTGCATALHLAATGRTVVLVGTFGKDLGPVNRWVNLSYLKKRRIELRPEARLEEVVDSGIVVRERGERLAVPVDAVVLATGVRPANALSERLEAKGIRTHVVGDCKEPRNILSAVHEAFDVAVSI